MCDDIDEMVEYINEEEENIENIDSSEIKILVEGARAVLDLIIAIKINKFEKLFKFLFDC